MKLLLQTLYEIADKVVIFCGSWSFHHVYVILVEAGTDPRLHHGVVKTNVQASSVK